MSFSKIKEIRVLNDEELIKEIVLGRKQLFELRLNQGTKLKKQGLKSHSFRHLKHRLSQLWTVKSQRSTPNKRKD